MLMVSIRHQAFRCFSIQVRDRTPDCLWRWYRVGLSETSLKRDTLSHWAISQDRYCLERDLSWVYREISQEKYLYRLERVSSLLRYYPSSETPREICLASNEISLESMVRSLEISLMRSLLRDIEDIALASKAISLESMACCSSSIYSCLFNHLRILQQR